MQHRFRHIAPISQSSYSLRPPSPPSAQLSDKPAPGNLDQQRKKRKEKIVKDLLDTIILSFLKGQPKCGYDILAFVHKEFQVLLSPGTLYPLLYSLERDGILKKELAGRKKIYALNGQSCYFDDLLNIQRKIFSFAERNSNGALKKDDGALKDDNDKLLQGGRYDQQPRKMKQAAGMAL